MVNPVYIVTLVFCTKWSKCKFKSIIEKFLLQIADFFFKQSRVYIHSLYMYMYIHSLYMYIHSLYMYMYIHYTCTFIHYTCIHSFIIHVHVHSFIIHSLYLPLSFVASRCSMPRSKLLISNSI